MSHETDLLGKVLVKGQQIFYFIHTNSYLICQRIYGKQVGMNVTHLACCHRGSKLELSSA